MGISWNPLYGRPWTILKTSLETTISFSSLTTSFYFLITTSLFSLVHQHGYEKKINKCVFHVHEMYFNFN
jgi:hypothetical protein